MSTATIICVKWGTKYPSYYVNRLYSGVARNLAQPFRFFCMTDDTVGIDSVVETLPLPVEPYDAVMKAGLATSKRQGAFGKISLFKPGLFESDGPILGFDLDVAITGSLDDLFTHEPGKICMRHDWLAQRRGRPDGHGSVFRFDSALHSYLYDEFAADPLGSMERANFSEQQYTSLAARTHDDFAYFPDDWIASFKRNAMHTPPLNHFLTPKLPEATRVMCFHGKPKMEEAVEGYRAGFFRSTKAAPWLKTHWLD